MVKKNYEKSFWVASEFQKPVLFLFLVSDTREELCSVVIKKTLMKSFYFITLFSVENFIRKYSINFVVRLVRITFCFILHLSALKSFNE